SEDPMTTFLPIINSINFDALTSLASMTRRARNPSLSAEVSCSVQFPPMYGSSNLVYVLAFSDGVKWIARIPGKAATFGPLNVLRMSSDIGTISLLRARTSIPIPEVFAWDTCSAAIGTPYTIEAFVEGVSVIAKWDDESWPESSRLTVLRNLAKFMAELSQFRYDKIGALCFTKTGEVSHVGEMVDNEIDFRELMMDEGADPWGITSATGPFETTLSWLRTRANNSMKKETLTGRIAEMALLHLAIDSIPPSLLPGPFGLVHPDFDSQNIFIDDDGNITGMIDWDGVCTLPRALGFARYPSWLTRDWDPVCYGYGIPGSGREDSPEQLLHYRKEYATALVELDLPSELYSATETRLSHLLEAIVIATQNRICRTQIILKLLSHA
ncbi:phosphotransferase enzyme family-domain-containing protein, partial [Geopyxis carbonaria]